MVVVKVCPWCGKIARITYEENRVYQMSCEYCHNTVLHMDHSFDAAERFFNQMIPAVQAQRKIGQQELADVPILLCYFE